MKILIVEDEPKVLEGLRAYCEVNGHTVQTADTGQGGMELVERYQPDIALLDLWLKDKINGMEVLKRARETSPLTAVIIITGFQEESSREDAIRAGARALLRKPIQLDELDSLIAQIVQRPPASAN